MRSALPPPPPLLLLLLLGALSCDGADSTTPAAPANVAPAASTSQSGPGPMPPATGASTISAQGTPSTQASSPALSGSPRPTSGSVAATSRTAPGPGPVGPTAKVPSDTSRVPSSSANPTVPLQSSPGAFAGATQDAGPKPTSSSASLPGKATETSPSKKPEQTTGRPPPAFPTVPGAAPGGVATTPTGGGVAVTPKSPSSTNAETAHATTQPARPAASSPKGTTAVAPTAAKDAKDAPLATSPSTSATPHTGMSSPKSPAAADMPSLSPPVRQEPSPDSRVPPTEAPAQSKIVCEKQMPPRDTAIVLTLNMSISCDGLGNTPLKETLLDLLCRAVKPGFNRSQDDCTVTVASSAANPRELAIIRASVTTHSMDEVLSEALASKKGELEKLGVSDMTHSGRLLDTEDRFGMPLIITIVCMAALLLLVAAIYGCCRQRISHRKDQQRLTEELQTMENGYHDNPTLEVMETSSEMQEKKVNLNRELGDSWIVPMDSLTKEDLDEEEDTHL